MTRICNNCTKEYEAKSKTSRYCSEACKQTAKRNRTVSPSVSRHDKSSKSDTVNDTVVLTKTDQLFQDDVIARGVGKETGGSEHWLAFTDTVRTPSCSHCKKSFKTRLPLLNYCSPKCRSAEMSGITG